MSISENLPDHEQELRWRAWQEKSRRADRLADKWMKTLFSAVGVILLAWILYQVFRAKASSDPNQAQQAIRVQHVLIPIDSPVTSNS